MIWRRNQISKQSLDPVQTFFQTFEHIMIKDMTACGADDYVKELTEAENSLLLKLYK
jgi:hypothetical protein